MLKTKHMMKDIAKLKNRDLYVCHLCGGTDIEEQVWVDMNDYYTLESGQYHMVLSESSDVFWCRNCNSATKPQLKEKK